MYLVAGGVLVTALEIMDVIKIRWCRVKGFLAQFCLTQRVASQSRMKIWLLKLMKPLFSQARIIVKPRDRTLSKYRGTACLILS